MAPRDVGIRAHEAIVDRICRHAYGLVLALATVVLLLAVPHKLATQHVNVAQTLPGNAIVIYSDDPDIALGDDLPVYR